MDKIFSYSTISFLKHDLKHTLKMFEKMKFSPIELSLDHFLIKKEDPQLLKEFNLKIYIVDGGHCNFFSKRMRIIDTVGRQVELANILGCSNMRLFLGTLERQNFDEERVSIAVENINRVIEKYPTIKFFFENSTPGITNSPIVLKEILDKVNHPNIKTVFDPKTFEEDRVNPIIAAYILNPYIAHIHINTDFTPDHLVSYYSINNYIGYIGLENTINYGNMVMKLFDARARLKRILQ